MISVTSDMGWVHVVEFGCLGLVDLVSRMLNMVVIMFNFTIRVCKLIYAGW